MIKVGFCESVDDTLLKFAVIIAKADDGLVFCKHRQRDTLEIPGGHREAGEDILDTAKRELYEETGAVDFDIAPICVYYVDDGNDKTYGMLYFAQVKKFEGELHCEIENIVITEKLPDKWTYPLIQPLLLQEAQRRSGHLFN